MNKPERFDMARLFRVVQQEGDTTILPKGISASFSGYATGFTHKYWIRLKSILSDYSLRIVGSGETLQTSLHVAFKSGWSHNIQQNGTQQVKESWFIYS